MSSALSLSIGGRDYRLAVEAGQEERLRAVAARVDAAVSRLASSTVDRDRRLVLAAVTLADELISLEENRTGQAGEAEAFHAALAERLERLVALAQTPPSASTQGGTA